MIGRTISHYRITEYLGSGGMGVVYKAEDLKLKRTVALKFLPPELTRNTEARNRFIQEAQAASALDHPNICNIHEIDETPDGRTFICMSCYDGETLKEIIKRGPLPLDRAVNIIRQIALGLSEAHGRGIVHRDLKPANVVVTGDGTAKIVDFGLAKLRGSATVTLKGTTMGTVAYMAPEQAKGSAVDHRADLWSLGIVLYEMLSGKLPFESDFEQALVYAIVHEEAPPIEDQRKDIPQAIKQILQRALRKSPDERYQSANEFIGDLDALLTGGASMKPLLSRRGKKRRLLYATAGLATMVATALGVFYYGDRSEVIDSIAVLPMQNLSRDSTQDYFPDGLTAELITRLYGLRDLKVRSWQTVMAYKKTDKSPQEIGRELGVKAVLGSTFLRSGNTVRLGFQLTEAGSDRNLWGRTYERNAGEMLEVLAELSQSVAQEVHLSLTPSEQQAIGRSQKVDPQAYDLYLKAHAYIPSVFSLSEQDWHESMTQIREAVSRDPTCARFHVGLANVYLQGAAVGYVTADQLLREGGAAATRAVNLDSTSGEALHALAIIRMLNWEWEESVEDLSRAIALSPGNAFARMFLGSIMLVLNRGGEGIEQTRRGRELDPSFDPDGVILGSTYFMARQYDKALEVLQAGVQRSPKNADVRVVLAQLYAKMGLKKEALREVEQSFALGIPEENVITMLNNAITYALCGEQEKALTTLQRYLSSRKQTEAEPYWVAATYAALGMDREAFIWLDRAYDKRTGHMCYLNDVPWDNFRTDPRYIAMLEKVGLKKFLAPNR